MSGVRATLGVGLVVWAALLGVFGAPVTALIALGAAASTRIPGRWRTAAVLVLALALGTPTALLEYPRRIDAMRAKVDAGGDGALSVRDCASIWLLDVGVAVGGLFVGFPEAALETTLILIPDADGQRTFASSFPARDPRVRAVVDRWKQGSGSRFGPKRVAFGYEGGHARWRAALALDPITLTGERLPDGRLRIEGTVPCDYHPGARVPLLELPGYHLVIDETLFDALEHRGWMFPYTASWVWIE
ncbi:MAG: hypothetical protein H6735_01565 [Alphaproteobacteria bacterium]|nr:hypothetical protein [Alphaproteobacteria bacterium]